MRTFDIMRLLVGAMPTIVAVLRRRRAGRAGMLVIGFVMVLNVLLPTFSTFAMVILWLIAMAVALSNRADMSLARLLAGRVGARGSQPGPSLRAPSEDTQSQWRACSRCGGTGSQTCPSCQGRASWYESPQTASGVAQLTGCNYCSRSGKVQCGSCGGSGRSLS